MAFTGKQKRDSGGAIAKAPVSVTANNGRIGVIIRGSRFAPGTLLDVQVGIDEDYGMIRIVPGVGTPCSAFGKKGTAVSWNASRSISKRLPKLNRKDAFIVSTEGDSGALIVDLNITKGE